ncbi:MAG: gamma-glutamyl-gamma-aminobutyrate hydrolase family protein [Elusimicrobiota bacterium]
MNKRPVIGIVPGCIHPDPESPIYKNKTLLFVDEAINLWLQSVGAFPLLLPTAGIGLSIAAILEKIDGLLLQGGPDVCPRRYGETPLKDEWAGDAVRDAYELDIIRACLDEAKPVFGLCRGVQTLNVALGGKLFQDIGTQSESALVHRRGDIYDKNFHEIELTEGSNLQALYGGIKNAKVNSIHHQAIKDAADGLEVEARSKPDGIIEAVRLKDDERYARGVQWHPEWMDSEDESLLDTRPLIADFLRAVEGRVSQAR